MVQAKIGLLKSLDIWFKGEVLARGTCTHLDTLIPGLRTILRHVYWSTRGVNVFATEIYIYINMFTGAEHEQIYPGRYRWICFGKGEWPGRTATSGWCNNLRRYSMYTICKCLILDNRLLISLIWGTSLIWRTLKYSLLLSCWLSAEKFLASAQRKENGKATVPQIRFVFAEARNWVWQGVQQQLSGESCFKSWTRRQWLSCMYFEHNMMTKPCNSW